MAKNFGISQDSPQVQSAPLTADNEVATIRKALLDWKFWLKALAIVEAVLWIYVPVFHGGWLMDDDLYIAKNSLLSDPQRLWKAWFEPGSFIEYYPIEQSVQWAQWRMWGSNTLGYHLTNVLLHAFSALLVWRVLAKFKLRLAWLGGLLFAVHPALVESVVWIVELKNTLSLPPFLIAVCFYIEYENHHRKSDHYLSLGSFLIAMLCKISMAPFPAVILLYAWWRRGRIGWSDIRASIPFFIISLVLICLTMWSGEIYSNQHMMKISVPVEGILPRIALIGGTFSFYLATCLWPFGLLPIYQRWMIDPPSLAQLLPGPLLGVALYWLWINRAGWGRHALLGLSFFALNLAPFLGFIIISYMRFTWVMDHFLYVAIIGLIGLAVAVLELPVRGLSLAGLFLVQAPIVFLAGFLAWSSRNYAEKFTDQETLWNYTIVSNPQAWPAYNNLGGLLLKEGRASEAIKLFETALKLNPDYFEAHYNRGLSLEHLSRSSEAIEEYKRGLVLAPSNLEARFQLARALGHEGHLADSIEQFKIGLRECPQATASRVEMGALLMRAGRFQEAAETLEQIIDSYPDAASPHNDLGNVLYMLGQPAAAIDEYRKALRFNPDLVEAHNNLGGALQHNGHLDDAIPEFMTALRLDPADPKLHDNLGDALVQAGRREEAIKEYEAALHLDPRDVRARGSLAALRGPAAAESPHK